MPKFHPTPLIQDCWSSIGNITFFHRNGQCFYKRKINPVFPGTPAQFDQQQVHHRAILAWQHLPHSVQLRWNHYARSVPSHRPPYDNNHHISGHNLFVSAYHGFAQLGNEHVPVPQPFPQFPVATVRTVTARRMNGTDLQLECSILMKTDTPPSRYRLSARIQLAEIGEGRNAGKMRSCLSETVDIRTLQEASESGTYEMIIRFTPYALRSVSVPQGDRMNVYSKFFLIDQVTGYRKMVVLSKQHHNALTAFGE